MDKDAFISNIKKVVQQDPKTHPNFEVHGSTLLYKGRRVLPVDAPVIPQIL